MKLPPWAEGPFETLLHGEQHFRGRQQGFDGRMALISFDNAIEIAIGTYLSLHPLQRGGRVYERKAVENWNTNYHTKLEFLECEFAQRGVRLPVGIPYIVYFHQLRGQQYHEGGRSDPKWHHIESLREAAICVFSTLYDVPDVESLLNEYLFQAREPVSDIPERDETLDAVLEETFGTVIVAGIEYSTSELLHAVDARAYKEIALELLESRTKPLSIAS